MTNRPPAGVLTKAAIDAYVQSGGAACPFCLNAEALRPLSTPQAVGSEWVYGIEIPMSCLNCGRKWAELYKLTTIEERT